VAAHAVIEAKGNGSWTLFDLAVVLDRANGRYATSVMFGDSRSSIAGSEAEGLLADEALIDQRD
jgi:hypothetical protein